MLYNEIQHIVTLTVILLVLIACPGNYVIVALRRVLTDWILRLTTVRGAMVIMVTDVTDISDLVSGSYSASILWQ